MAVTAAEPEEVIGSITLLEAVMDWFDVAKKQPGDGGSAR